MKLLIAAIGKPRPSPEQSLVDEYVRRMPWECEVKWFESPKRDAGQRQQHEAEWLLATTQGWPVRMVLDERGKPLTSQAFADTLAQQQLHGTARVAFLIGGADGHTDAVRASATRLLSLSAMTLPHLLARAVLAEQLYRASCIISGHPYHRA